MVWIILGAIVALIVDLICAIELNDIAKEKGHANVKYFWYSFLFGIFGALIVIALPDRGKQPEKRTPPPSPARILPNPESFTVPKEKNDDKNKERTIEKKENIEYGKVEIVDGKKQSIVKIVDGRIICPSCGTNQNGDRTVCMECGCKFIRYWPE